MLDAHAWSRTSRSFQSLNDALRHWREATPDALALAFHDGRGTPEELLTFRELDRKAAQMAHALRCRLDEGARVVLAFHPGTDYVATFLACAYAGIVAVTGSPPDELRRAARLSGLVTDSGAVAVLTHGQLAQKLAAQGGAGALAVIDVTKLELGPELEQRPVSPDDLVFLQYTSGSTSEPKGVMISHGALNANLGMVAPRLRFTPDSVVVSWLPLFHDMGLVLMVLGTLHAGRPVHLMAPTAFVTRPLAWLELVERVRATHTGAPDFAFRLCRERIKEADRRRLDLSSLTVLINGSEPIRPAATAGFLEDFAVSGLRREALASGYGLAEVCVLLSVGRILERLTAFDADALEEGRAVPVGDGRGRFVASCGRIEPEDYRFAIVDPATGRPRADGEVGELWVSGRSVAAGYWGKPEATRATFENRIDGRDGNFLNTGDLGFIHRGELHICGRSKEMMIIRGRNIFPADVCEAVETGVASMKGRRAAAFSVDGAEEEELVVICAAAITAAMAEREAARVKAAVVEAVGVTPATILFVQNRDLKRTTSGKVQHGAMRAAFLAGELPVIAARSRHDPTPPAPEPAPTDAADVPDWLLTRVRQTCAEICECVSIDGDENLFERGLDSLRGMKLVGELRARFSGATNPVSLGDIVELKTPRKIAAAVLTPAAHTTRRSFKEISV